MMMMQILSLSIFVATYGLLAPTQHKTVHRVHVRPQAKLRPTTATKFAIAGKSSGSLGVRLWSSPREKEIENERPWFVDPGTYGGVIVLTILGLTVPFAIYSALISTGLDPTQTGVAMSGILVVGSIILWTLSYVFRVFTKNMTYGEQLRRYEDAVIQKRFEELQEDEVAALMSEIEREKALEATSGQTN